MLIRASHGTLVKMGMLRGRMESEPRTAYLLQYSRDGCMGTCSFCAQSMHNPARKDRLSRITWPPVELESIIDKLHDFDRICLQTIIKPRFEEEIISILDELSKCGKSISLATTPVSIDFLKRAMEKGVDFLGVGLDASSENVFRLVKKPFSWEIYMKFIEDSVGVFGRGRVYVHLIYGIGETIEDMMRIMKKLRSMGAEIALFSFTPNEDGKYPDIHGYRAVQLYRYLLSGESELKDAFLTSGCPGCNRPFYNERPGGPIYNYPSREMLERDWNKIKEEILDMMEGAAWRR
ncbi:MAG: radical SAM protein [Candidatus Methanodesulfokora sp.]